MLMNRIFDLNVFFSAEYGKFYLFESEFNFSVKQLKENEEYSKVIKIIKYLTKGEMNKKNCLTYEITGIGENNFENVFYYFKEKNYVDLLYLAERRFGKTDPLILYIASLCKKDSLVFFDIETTGTFYSCPLFLICIARCIGDSIIVKQFFSPTEKEEKAILYEFIRNTRKEDIFVSFRGKNFDMPFIKNRSNFHNIDFNLCNSFHIDLYYFSKRIIEPKLNNYRLKSIEENFLNIRRKGDIESYLVPEYYFTYKRTNDEKYLKPILVHNCYDVISLVILFYELLKKISSSYNV